MYKVLSEMAGASKETVSDDLHCYLEGFTRDDTLDLPGLDSVPRGDVYDALVVAKANLTLDSIDVGLYQLAKVLS